MDYISTLRHFFVKVNIRYKTVSWLHGDLKSTHTFTLSNFMY